jgi:pilus assembly protein CpaB
LKRSNRLILLLGFILAIVAFVGIILVFNGSKTNTPTVPTTGTIVVAASDIALGETIQANQVTTKTLPLPLPLDTFTDTSLVIGRIARADVATGQAITSSTFAQGGVIVQDIAPTIGKGKRAMSVDVDQISGVGTLIKAGDRVDLVVGISGPEKFPVLVPDPTTQVLTPLNGVNSTSVKLILQNLKVLGTLLPPAEASQNQSSDGQASPQPGTALNGQREIVILEVDPEQSEIIRFAQIDGTITLILRATKDFVDDQGNPIDPSTVAAEEVRGIILKRLVDEFGVLTPQIVETVLPKTAATPRP